MVDPTHMEQVHIPVPILHNRTSMVRLSSTPRAHRYRKKASRYPKGPVCQFEHSLRSAPDARQLDPMKYDVDACNHLRYVQSIQQNIRCDSLLNPVLRLIEVNVRQVKTPPADPHPVPSARCREACKCRAVIGCNSLERGILHAGPDPGSLATLEAADTTGAVQGGRNSCMSASGRC
jgi:hypothetical protein